jgi:hypothetical protein
MLVMNRWSSEAFQVDASVDEFIIAARLRIEKRAV